MRIHKKSSAHEHLLVVPVTLTEAVWPILGGSGVKLIVLKVTGEPGGEQLVKSAETYAKKATRRTIIAARIVVS